MIALRYLCVFHGNQGEFAVNKRRTGLNFTSSNPPLGTGCSHPGCELRPQKLQTPPATAGLVWHRAVYCCRKVMRMQNRSLMLPPFPLRPNKGRQRPLCRTAVESPSFCGIGAAPDKGRDYQGPRFPPNVSLLAETAATIAFAPPFNLRCSSRHGEGRDRQSTVKIVGGRRSRRADTTKSRLRPVRIFCTGYFDHNFQYIKAAIIKKQSF